MKGITYFDLYRYSGKMDKKTWLKTFIFTPSFTYIVFFRMVKNNKNLILRIILKFFLKILQIIYHFQIPEQVEVGKGFYISHFGRIIINPNTKIGKNVNIGTGVVLGQANRGEKRGSPIIGDGVWIGANAVIVGKVKIGNNVLIAPNSYINIDIPDNSIVTGNPAIVTYREDATRGYLQYPID